MAEQDINNLVNQVSAGGTLTLTPPKCECEGPIVIRKPLILIGQQGLIWGKKGPVLKIECSGVVIQDLNIEVTGREEKLMGEEACAIIVAPGLGVTLNDVCVRGNVNGLSQEEGNWRYPRSLQIKATPNQKQEFHAKFTVPVPCRLISDVAGLSVEPCNLMAGDTDVKLILDPLAPGVRIRGEISLKTAFLIRQIAVVANVSASVSEADRLQVAFWDSLSAGTPAVPTPPMTQEASATVPPAPKASAGRPKPAKKSGSTELGPTSTPALKPIPEKIEPKRIPVKDPVPQEPNVFDPEKAALSPLSASKIKSIPLTGMWSQSIEKPAKDDMSSAPPDATQQENVVIDPIRHIESATAQSVAAANSDIAESCKTNACAAKRPVLSFSAFQPPQADDIPQPTSIVKNEENENNANCEPSQKKENKEGAEVNNEPCPIVIETPKSRKLRKTHGSFGAFGGGE